MKTSEAPHAPHADEAARLKIVIVGHVDHGKSTLIGRLFHDTDSLPEGKVEAIRAACAAEGMEFEYAFLLDALLEEQEQNITIDTTQIQFRTSRRSYVIIDAPGHKEFLKNMITGAASADAAILLIDAHEGIQEQSKRHALLLSLLGIGQVVVAVNKMDLVDFSAAVFEGIVADYTHFLGRLGITPAHFVPISARGGENIIAPSPRMPWFKGPSILAALDSFSQPPVQEGAPARLLVQDIYRFDERRIIAGRLESGTLRIGDEIMFTPDRKRSRIRSFETWPAGSSKDSVRAGESVALTLEEQIFVERGQIGSHVAEAPAQGREIEASLFWIAHEPLAVNHPCTLKLGTQSFEARVVKVTRVLDSSSLEALPGPHPQIRRNEVAEVAIRIRRPIAFDRHDRVPATGRFVLVAGGRIGGGGIIRHADYAAGPRAGVASGDITWTVGRITREDRASTLGHRGAVVWMTGLSGAGKSTLAVALEAWLHRSGRMACVLDGDNLRHGLCSDLKFGDADRVENIRRAGEVARLMAEAGLIVVCSLISPFAAERERVRQLCHGDGLPFAEVYVSAPLEVCEQRDPRHLYRKARAGEIRGFTGIDAPYEAPERPDLVLPTSELSFEGCLQRLADHVVDLTSLQRGEFAGLVEPPGEGI